LHCRKFCPSGFFFAAPFGCCLGQCCNLTILTMVDRNTRVVSTIPLVSKSDVVSALTCLLDVKARQFGYHPSILHSNLGTEFTNAKLGDYCHKHVIRQRFLDVYSPQQNGLAERFN
jgi:transposase InsO family protein